MDQVVLYTFDKPISMPDWLNSGLKHNYHGLTSVLTTLDNTVLDDLRPRVVPGHKLFAYVEGRPVVYRASDVPFEVGASVMLSPSDKVLPVKLAQVPVIDQRRIIRLEDYLGIRVSVSESWIKWRQGLSSRPKPLHQILNELA